MSPQNPGALHEIEMTLLLEGIFQQYGYDFRNYARASLNRRVNRAAASEGLKSVSGLQEKILHDSACFERLLLSLTVNVTAMFRNPGFFVAFREQVTPLLKTYPFIRIWCAGCSTGEEVYSLAILLEEEGLYDRCRLYATDVNEAVLRRARDGMFSLADMQKYTANYLKAGGTRSFSHYYSAAYDQAILLPDLKRHILFAEHNLTTDAAFNEFHVILCRNVLIYFNRTLQERVHRLFHESLSLSGVLGLGEKESLRLTPRETCYEPVCHTEKLYRKVS